MFKFKAERDIKTKGTFLTNQLQIKMEFTLIKDGRLKISEPSAAEKMTATHTRETGREKIFVKCCFTSTETSETRRGAQDDHVDFHTAPELCRSNVCFSVVLRPQKPSGLFGTGSPGRPPRLSHSS